ncbi:MAG TPA: hypothetical protein ENJ43_01200, partial [Gammaproteobacteria bacterium]|nr:hypothetical protein [Gammaproteobacteria bacterium]
MSRYRLFSLLILPIFLHCTPLQARVIQIPEQEVKQLLDDYAASGVRLQQLLEERLQQAYDELEGVWAQVDPVYEFSLQDMVVEEGCSLTSVVERMDGAIRLQEEGSSARLRVTSLTEPLSVNMVLQANLDARGRIEQERGIRAFGRCNSYAQYGFDFAADGILVLRLDGDVTSRVEFTEQGIRYSPTLALRVGFERISYAIDVDDDLFGSLVEEKIDDAIRPFLDQGVAGELARRLEQQFRDALIDSWGAEYLDIRLPELDRQRLEELAARVEREQREGEFQLEDNLGELYYFLLSADEEAWDRLLNDRAMCELGEYLMVEMPSEPLYQMSEGECRAVEGDVAAGSYYADASCRHSVLYRPLDLQNYCGVLSDMARSGRPATGMGEPPLWYRSPGARLDIGVDSIAGNHLPYSSRTIYKNTFGPRGQCGLEMEIYKRSLDATGLKPLLMLHGGSWERRRSGLVGMESQVSHYTDQGFVVFVPTYRLVGEIEGDPACNGADGEQMVADVEDALQWVQEHGGEFGSRGGPVAVL